MIREIPFKYCLGSLKTNLKNLKHSYVNIIREVQFFEAFERVLAKIFFFLFERMFAIS
jgi:hypothetical protein